MEYYYLIHENKKLSQVTEAIQAVLLAEVQQHMKRLRNTPVSSQPDPVAEYGICESMRSSAKMEQAEELELQCVGKSSPLKSKWVASSHQSSHSTQNVLESPSLQCSISLWISYTPLLTSSIKSL